MANNLSIEKQTTAIHALCEGSSIRSVERMTGIHRDTIMRLGVRVGEACKVMMDEKLRNLDCGVIEVDEIWGYVGKKRTHIKPTDNRQEVGDAWTYIALDSETKLIPCFSVVPARNHWETKSFLMDLQMRMKNRIQLTSDGMNRYEQAVVETLGENVDYAQIVKTYSVSKLSKEAAGRYSPAEVVHAEKKSDVGQS